MKKSIALLVALIAFCAMVLPAASLDGRAGGRHQIESDWLNPNQVSTVTTLQYYSWNNWGYSYPYTYYNTYYGYPYTYYYGYPYTYYYGYPYTYYYGYPYTYYYGYPYTYYYGYPYTYYYGYPY